MLENVILTKFFKHSACFVGDKLHPCCPAEVPGSVWRKQLTDSTQANS